MCRCRARCSEPGRAFGKERERFWQAIAEIWPPYEEYAETTKREIVVVVLERH
jgi:F420H(2)-dependent quinone reductase